MGERDPIEAGEGARNEARAHSWLNLSRFEGRLIEFAKRRNDIYWRGRARQGANRLVPGSAPGCRTGNGGKLSNS